MKYTIPFLMVILTMSFFACKKKKNNDTPAPEVQRLPASFTGMKTWRYSSTYIVSHAPDRDTTVYGTTDFDVNYLKGDTVLIKGHRLLFKSTEGDSSSRFVLNYQGMESPTGPLHVYSASFIHTPSGDSIYYSGEVSGFGISSGSSYVTP